MKILPGKNNAFTLVELLMAVGIIAVMTGIAIPNYLNKIREQELKNGAQQVLTDIRRTSVKSQTSIEGTGWYLTTTINTGNYAVYKFSDPDNPVFTGTLSPSFLTFKDTKNLFFQKNTGILVDSTETDAIQIASPIKIIVKHSKIDGKCTNIYVSDSGTISYDETNAISTDCD